ncbi:C39 family peptidase [Oribacterium sp. WCC10]|uniref:C39 family peptidase n=1 Tax=Oribacterium sp. WCC10 TaxID=1855343 RepID=UPI0008E9857E|nr:C39 family peptidase [Oribacterium sp. WCC10]SFG24125.1 Peptidase_C39 like family protein [Oribacterium sp. WCC10]
MAVRAADNRIHTWDGINYDRRDAHVTGGVTAGGFVAKKTFRQRWLGFHRAFMEFSDDISDQKAAIKDFLAEQKAENDNLRANLTKQEILIGLAIRTGILISAITLVLSIVYLIRPYTAQDVYDTGITAASNAYTTAHIPVDVYYEYQERKSIAEAARDAFLSQIGLDKKAQDLLDTHLSYTDIKGNPRLYEEAPVDDLGLKIPETLHYVYNDYNSVLDTAMGSMLYFSQGDSHWKEYRIAGVDRMGGYGCGPVTIAMLVNSFADIDSPVTPIEVADWAVENHEYAVHGGSYHSLIPNALSHYGLSCASVEDRTPENVSKLLDTGHVLVALMGKGSLTDVGHFVILTENAPNGEVMLADPAKFANCQKSWPLAQILKELKAAYDAGGPLWAVTW